MLYCILTVNIFAVLYISNFAWSDLSTNTDKEESEKAKHFLFRKSSFEDVSLFLISILKMIANERCTLGVSDNYMH